MKRKLFFAERMLHGDGKSPFNVVVPISLNGSFSDDSLHGALKKLQKKHPFLNARVRLDKDRIPWFVVKEGENPPIPVRIVEREDNDTWQRESMKEWSLAFETGQEPLMRVVWIRDSGVSELILVMHHCLCDGGSAMALLAGLLVLLDTINADIGQETPIMGLRDIVPSSILHSKRKGMKASLIGKTANLILRVMPVKKRLVERKKDYMIHWKLDKTQSSSLMMRCREEGVTVNTILCLAVLDAFEVVRKQQFHNKISCPVDIRKYAPMIKKNNIFAIGLMFVVSSEKGTDFFSRARKMQEAINGKMQRLEPYTTLMMMEASHSSLNRFTKFLKYSKSSNDCMFSNLGKIDIPHQYGSFTVESICSPSVIGPLGNTTTMITSTYRGQMDFTVVGSEGFLPHAEGMEIKEELTKILLAL